MKSISRRGLFKMGAALAAAPPPFELRARHSVHDGSGRRHAGAGRARAVDPTHHILLRGGTIVTMDPAVGDFATGDVLHPGKAHRRGGPGSQSARRGAQIIDATGTIVIPGFVDCHRHSWSAQFRRIIPDGLIATTCRRRTRALRRSIVRTTCTSGI